MRTDRVLHLSIALLMVGLAVATRAGPVVAHGAGHTPVTRIIERGAVAVEFGLSSGEPLAGASVRVFAPESTGGAPGVARVVRTDGHGRAAFVPDGPGVWRLEATDPDGHVATASIEVMADGVVTPPPSWRRWLLRGSLLVNLVLMGLLLHLGYAQRRQAHGHSHGHHHQNDHTHHDHTHSQDHHTHHHHDHDHGLQAMGRAAR